MLKGWIDSLCNATHINPNFYIHEAVGATVLQKVILPSLACPHHLICTRIFKGTFVKPSVWTMIVVVFVWTVAFFFANLFQCWPLWIDWTAFGSTPENCINTNIMYLAQAWSDVLTDGKNCLGFGLSASNFSKVIILTLPLPCVGSPYSLKLISADHFQIWIMQLPVRHKVAVSGMFLLGGLYVVEPQSDESPLLIKSQNRRSGDCEACSF